MYNIYIIVNLHDLIIDLGINFVKDFFDRLLISLPEEISLVVNLPTFLVYY